MIDSDEEDSDCLSPVNAQNYSERNTMIRLKGPHYESTRMCKLPQNFEKQRYCNEYAERDLLERRPTSPMSYRSTSDRLPRREYGHSLMPPHNVHQSFYNGGYPSGRPGSSMSMISMGSINSVTSDIIVSAVKSGRFDKYQLRSIIHEANNKLMKGRVRKRIAKRRNLKMFLKSARRASGGESGDQAMDSSSSSDDCRSTRTGVTRYGGYENYASSSKYVRKDRQCDDARSVRTDFTDLRKTIREHNGYRNCSGEFEQSSFKNMFNLGPRQMNNTSMARINYSVGPAHSTTINTTLRDRFKSSFMLPSQRFNKSTAQPVLGHIGNRNYNYNANQQRERIKNTFLLPSERFNKTSTMVHISEDRDDILEVRNSRAQSPILKPRNYKHKNTTQNFRTDSDEDQCEVTVLEKSVEGKIETPKSIRKRNLSSSDEAMPRSNLSSSDEAMPRRNKLKKHATPEKVANKVKNAQPSCNFDKKQEDFSFAKPTLPVKKPTVAKVNILKNRITHSEVPQTINKVVDCGLNNKECTNEKLDACEDPSDSTLYTSDMSMRPSFIKRKLFTQSLEVAESKNVSSDSSPSSPQKQKRPYTDDPNEKNKTRKLVPSSSYMARSVDDDSNLLDLIHKIVPPDRMNITQQKPQSKCNVDMKQKEVPDDKWDISSIITTNDVDANSCTFSNEDIFENNDSDFVVKPKKTVKNSLPKPVVQNAKPVAQNAKSVSQNAKPVAQSAKPVNTTLKKSTVVFERFNIDSSEDSALLLVQETIGGGGSKKPDIAERSVFHYANKFWNCDSESDAPDTPNHRRTRNVHLNDTPPAGLHKKNTQADKNMQLSKENVNVKNTAINAEQPVRKKPIPLVKVNDKPFIEKKPRRTRYNSSMDSSQNSSTMETRSRDSKIKTTNNNLKTTVNKENGKGKANAKPPPANNVLKPVANKTTSNSNVNLNDSQKAKQNKNSKNNNKKVQDTSLTPARQSARLKLNKQDSSSDAINNTIRHGSISRKPYQNKSENKENTKYSIASKITNKITKPAANKYLNNISNKTLVKNSKKPERPEEPYRHVVKKVHTTRAGSASDTSITPTRRSTRIQLKHDSSNESNNITRFLYRSMQLGLRHQRELCK